MPNIGKIAKLLEEIIKEGKLFHGSPLKGLKSGKDLPKGHRGYFLTDDEKVAGKFGNVYGAKVGEGKLFDGRVKENEDALFNAYSKVRSVNNPEWIRDAIRSGRYAFYEDPIVKMALEDMGYKGNWQVEDGANTIRLFDRNMIKGLESPTRKLK